MAHLKYNNTYETRNQSNQKKGDDQINLEFVVRKPNGKGLKSEVIYFFDEDGDYELADYSTALEE